MSVKRREKCFNDSHYVVKSTVIYEERFKNIVVYTNVPRLFNLYQLNSKEMKEISLFHCKCLFGHEPHPHRDRKAYFDGFQEGEKRSRSGVRRKEVWICLGPGWMIVDGYNRELRSWTSFGAQKQMIEDKEEGERKIEEELAIDVAEDRSASAEEGFAETNLVEAEISHQKFAGVQFAHPKFAEADFAPPKFAEFAQPKIDGGEKTETKKNIGSASAEEGFAETNLAEAEISHQKFAGVQFAHPKFAEADFAPLKFAEFAQPKIDGEGTDTKENIGSDFAEEQFAEPAELAHQKFAGIEFAHPKFAQAESEEKPAVIE
ncbi:uncharacterized protein LOC122065752 isoform X3 [Macadamia integrifolia]|uniref:uncharacterized protein LOC122065752 isoform X3 n=1 Tax=Macadamia integrifolia TaxID=60698 RepID=UPI001C4F09EE|nr:uncharacterized protein LOC122065752 isoform X3 [Macadamia integrifolia]